MPPLIAAAIITAFGITSATGIAIAQAAASLIMMAISIGLQILLTPKPKLPAPTDGHQATRQNIPARIMACGRCRPAPLAYVLYETSGGTSTLSGTSYDVVAVAEGPIAGFVKYYLHDDEVTLDEFGLVTGTPEFADLRYIDYVNIKTRLGVFPETAYQDSVAAFPGLWTSSHRGDGVASFQLRCFGVSQAAFQAKYPYGLPNLTPVIDGPPLWDIRDTAQSYGDKSTWTNYPVYSSSTTYPVGTRVKYLGAVYRSLANGNAGHAPDTSQNKWYPVFSNPVLRLIDYLLDPAHGMGLSVETLITPSIAALRTQADLCEVLVQKKDLDLEPRYRADGFYLFDTNPTEVIAAVQASCDGWMVQGLDGALNLRVGVYSPPTVPTIGARHIIDTSFDLGISDEEKVNEIKMSFTSPEHKYKIIAGQSWRDEEDITDRGATRSTQLQLSWVQSHGQARRLTKRAFARMDALMRGTTVTTLYGLVITGERWIRMQDPRFAAVSDIVVEVTRASVDLANGQVSFDWVLVNPNSIDAWDALTEEGAVPALPDSGPQDDLPVPQDVRAKIAGTATSGTSLTITFDDPARSTLHYVIRYRLVDIGNGTPGPFVEQATVQFTTDGTTVTLQVVVPVSNSGYVVEVASAGVTNARSDWSDSITVSTNPSSRALESGGARLLEDGSVRLLE